MKKRLVALLLILACVCLSGCAVLEEKVIEMVATQVERTGLEAPTRTIVDALFARDIDQMLSALAPEFTKENLQDSFEQMCAILPQAEEYTLTATSWNTKTSSDVTQTTVQFLLTVADQTFVVETTSLSNVERVAHFYIAPVQFQENAPAAENSGEVSPVETALAIIAVLEALFVVWALVDCCCHKISRKWLYILLILFGNTLLSIAVHSGQASFRLNFGLHLTATSLQLLENGFHLKVLIPAGSVWYLARRSVLISPPNTRAFNEAFEADLQDSPAATMNVSDEKPDTPVE